MIKHANNILNLCCYLNGEYWKNLLQENNLNELLLKLNSDLINHDTFISKSLGYFLL